MLKEEQEGEYHVYHYMGCSLVKAQMYWGNRLAFLAGIEMMHPYFDVYYQEISLEAVTTQIGVAVLRKPVLNEYGIKQFVPRIELSTGITFFYTGPTDVTTPIMRTDFTLMLFRFCYFQLEHRWVPFDDRFWVYDNSFNISFCLTLGKDILR